MATYQRKRVASDVAAGSSSSESLSFAGLLSIQDLHSKSPIAHSFNHTKSHNQELEFSFSTTEFSANNSNKMSSTNTSISNGQQQIQLQAFLRQSRMVQKPGSKAVTRRNNKRPNDKGTDEVKVSDKTEHKARNQENKDRSVSSSSLGKKIFHSFFSPCRECHAHKPATKENSMPAETVKTY